MNLKKTLLSFMAAGSILAGGFAGVAQAADYSPQTTGVVTVTTDNTFNPYFCSGNVDFGTVALNSASTDATRVVNGQVVMCYTDTTAQRGTFVATLRSSDFTTVYTSDTIAASNLKPKTVFNPQQGQNSTAVCGPNGPTTRPCIGDIGGYNGNGGKVTSGGPNYNGTAWDGGNLSGSGEKIAYGWNGKGTANMSSYESDWRLFYGSYHVVDLTLNVPQNTPANQYFSTLTLDVNMNAAP